MNKKNGYQVGWNIQVLGIFLLILLPSSVESFGRATHSPMKKGVSGVGHGARGADFSGMGFDSNRAPRLDALSTPQIVSPFNAAGLEEIKQCICELKQLIINGNTENCCSAVDVILSKVNKIDTQIDVIISSLGALSNIDGFISDLDILVSVIEQLNVDVLTSLIIVLEGVNSLLDPLSSKIDLDIAIDQTTLSKVMVIDTRTSSIYSVDQTILSVVEVIAAGGEACSCINVVKSDLDALTVLLQANFSATAVIGSVVQTIVIDLSLLPVIDSKCSNILYNIGSRGDFAYSHTDQLSTIDQINALDLTVIAWLKTLLADLHGL